MSTASVVLASYGVFLCLHVLMYKMSTSFLVECEMYEYTHNVLCIVSDT